MLVLSRRENESILIGDDIEITICRVAGRTVSIGLQAPRDLKIIRRELSQLPYEEIRGPSGPLREFVQLRRN